MQPGSASKDDRDVLAAQSRALTDGGRWAIARLDGQGSIMTWNAAAEKLYGCSCQRAIGRQYTDFIPPARHGEWHTAIGKIRHRRQVPRRQTLRLRADGTELEVEFSLHGLWVGDPQELHLLTVSEDISQRSALETELKRHAEHTQAILDTVVDGIVSIDRQGMITAVNPSIETMFGYRGHELIGRNVNVLMPEPFHSEHDAYLANYRKTGHKKIIGIGREVQGKRRDGSVFPVDLAVSELTGDGLGGFVGVMRDVTERHEAARALESLNETLQGKVSELADTLDRLQRMQGQLVESEKLASLGGLVGGVAHEINTPIGVSLTAASILSGSAGDIGQALDEGRLHASELKNFLSEVQEAGGILERNLERAAELVRSFKQVAVDRSSNLKRRFGLKVFLDELLASLKPEFRNREVTVTVDCDSSIQMDSLPGALSQVLTNLLQNALVHAFPTDRSGAINLVATRQGEHVRLVCRDDGEGMSAETAKKIFDPFYTTKRGRGGTGLGMSVAYNLVTQALQGEISVVSERGEGSCFTLNLPIELTHEETR